MDVYIYMYICMYAYMEHISSVGPAWARAARPSVPTLLPSYSNAKLSQQPAANEIIFFKGQGNSE